LYVSYTQANILRVIVSHIIRETPSLYALLRVGKDCPSPKFRIQINHDNQPSASKNNCHIIVGIGDFNKLYDICCFLKILIIWIFARVATLFRTATEFALTGFCADRYCTNG
jgi:hypothetical protein